MWWPQPSSWGHVHLWMLRRTVLKGFKITPDIKRWPFAEPATRYDDWNNNQTSATAQHPQTKLYTLLRLNDVYMASFLCAIRKNSAGQIKSKTHGNDLKICPKNSGSMCSLSALESTTSHWIIHHLTWRRSAVVRLPIKLHASFVSAPHIEILRFYVAL